LLYLVTSCGTMTILLFLFAIWALEIR